MNAGVRLILLCSMTALLYCNVVKAEQTVSEMRKTFLEAERFIYQGQDNEYFTLAETLKSYPLYPYLHYQWLKNHLDNNDAIRNFLTRYEQSRYAKLLRQKWLIQLGKTQQWQLFNDYYRNTDDTELQCYNNLAHYQLGQTNIALENIHQLWLSGKNLPNNCEAGFTLLKSSSFFNRDTIWQRFQTALQLNNISTAQSTAEQLPEQDKTAANLWLKLHKEPALVKENEDWKRNYPLAGSLFTHAIIRWLELDPYTALNDWELEKQNFIIPPQIIADIEKRLAMALAFKHDHQAFSKLIKLSNKDNNTREWAVRSALSQENWSEVNYALAELTNDEKAQDKWQYWQARTLAASGQMDAAQEIYLQIAKNRSFYGFLAADQLNQKINLINRPLNVSEQELQTMAEKPEFKVMSELLAISRKQEAKHQWWHATSGMDQRNLIIAAKLAQSWQSPALAIFTIAKANEWDDLDLRFPLNYLNTILENANNQQLDPSIIFGLIRQESAFDDSADSPAGAKGLMQIMPKTGQQMAQTLNEYWTGETMLLEPATNIKLGSFYYKKLLQQFNGKYFLAAAAYNAGPNRVKRWLPNTISTPGDVWIEGIPYKETRNYVTQVLLYTLIYQQRLQRDSLKLTDLISTVNPN